MIVRLQADNDLHRFQLKQRDGSNSWGLIPEPFQDEQPSRQGWQRYRADPRLAP
jgi:hypothetical protein